MKLPSIRFPREYKWVALTVTTVGAFMSALDATIVVTGLPTILDALGATIIHGIWIITGYQLTMTVLMVILGRLADIHGRVKLYALGFAVFGLGSLFCGLSADGTQLVIARFIEGAGAALLMVNSAAIIADAFPVNQLGMALGTNLMAINLGGIVGYTLSGFLIAAWGWRAIFLVNVPVGLFGTVWALKRLKEVSVRKHGQSFDWRGAIMYCVALTVMLLALTIGDPLSPRNLAILGAGLLGLLAAIYFSNRHRFPVLDLSLFRIRMFAAGNTASFLNSISFSCGPFLRSLYLQLVLGESALTAGVMLIPMEILVFIVNPISGRLCDRIGSRMLSSVGLALNAAALFWFATLNEHSSYAAILVSLMLFGFGRALFISPNASSVMGSVPPEKRGLANGFRMTLNMTGAVLSVPLSLLLMSLVMPYGHLSQIVSSAQLAGAGELDLFLKAINYACVVLGVITALAIIPSVLRGPRAPQEATAAG